ncbi:MAG: extracellular solute-binding protein [Lachnospiraceae bacterium]|jgi:ABC-type glycerol-3-phosphate transport system substrate-binding protein|nr:extracellular solute-binding protein [Lachnospiraceae bacterium]
MKDSVKKLLIFVGVIAAFVVFCLLLNLRGTKDFHEKYEGHNLDIDVTGAARTGTYSGYLRDHAGASTPKTDVEVSLYDYATEVGKAEVVSNYSGESQALLTDAGSTVTWKVDVPQAGFYNIYLEYLLPQSRGVAAERSVLINGELPFDDAGNMVFSRIWTDGGEKRVDNQGNEIRPTQVEIYDWQGAYCKDSMGYIADPYEFYFEQGENTVSFVAVNEPMVLRKIKLSAIKEIKSYAEYAASLPAVNPSSVGLTLNEVIEGEDSVRRSESSLYAKYDRSSATTSPYSVTKTILNYTGGDAWKSAGQWIEWDINVPETGYYHITVKGRQNYSRGSVSGRMLMIDGEVPFKEVKEIAFDYQNDWECKTLGNDDGPFNFYLTAGKHTLRLEATLGEVGKVLEELEDCTFRLNKIYRTILVYTGATPDKYRDYKIQNVYPESILAMELEARRLYKAVDDMVAISGQKASQIATAQTLATQLERFVDKPEKITTEFTNFKDNITALGTSILELSEIRLDVDYIRVAGTDAKVKKDKSNFFKNTGHEIKSFVASFFVDYEAVGDVYDENAKGDDKPLKVWVLTGRDQGTIMKALVDEEFTPQTGIKVNVQTVQAAAVLNAVMAGRGPDVLLSIGGDQPVNYALRGSAVDLTKFDGFEEVFSNFTPSSYAQYSLDGAVYGMPETQTFNVLFYRKDILEELELEVPNTWKELIEMFPTIQGNNMNIGMPSAAGTATTGSGGDLNLYFTMLYQYGGDLYNEKGTKTIVNDDAGVDAFADYVKFYNDYGCPTVYDFASRFRSGEMPIAVANYGMYNTLMVSAPEIRGLWDFTLVPGTEKTDEYGKTWIDRSDCIVGAASMILPSDDATEQKAWEFFKWWGATNTQVKFGREMEALLGASARYATANKNAFAQLAWSQHAIEVLTDQWEQTVGIREVPGGYYTGRHLTNAVRKCINEKADPRETILDYSILINEELTKKRKEFGLPLE